MRKEMQRRFKLLYRHYRHRKFGEPLPNQKINSGIVCKEMIEDGIKKEDLVPKRKISKMLTQRFDM